LGAPEALRLYAAPSAECRFLSLFGFKPRRRRSMWGRHPDFKRNLNHYLNVNVIYRMVDVSPS
jgi:hypothetical protein